MRHEDGGLQGAWIQWAQCAGCFQCLLKARVGAVVDQRGSITAREVAGVFGGMSGCAKESRTELNVVKKCPNLKSMAVSQ
jgi:deoxycytidylate deaminase